MWLLLRSFGCSAGLYVICGISKPPLPIPLTCHQLWLTELQDTVCLAAQHKLLYSWSGDTAFCCSNKHQVLAIYSQCICLKIAVSQAASQHTVEAVRAHMRILTRIEDQSITHTYVPSEPMLLIAACEILNRSLPDYVIAVHMLVNILACHSVIIKCGNQGKLFSWLLLCITQDQATCVKAQDVHLAN